MGMFPFRTNGPHLTRNAGRAVGMDVEALEPRKLLSVQFEPTESITSIESAVDVISSDFDRDGFADIAVAQNDRNIVTVLFGDAGSTFRRRTSLFTTERPVSMASEDFNEDTFLDLAVVTATGQINVFLTDGAGRMRRAGDGTIVSFPGDGTFVALDTVDVGPDGDWDLFGLSDQAISLIVNEGEGEFDGVLNIPNPANPPLIEGNYTLDFGASSLQFDGRDFDVILQEDIDEVNIIIAGQDTDQQDRGVIAILRENFPDPINNPIGPDFQQGFFISSFTDLPWAPSAVVQGDVSGDGRYDVIVVAETEPEIAVLTADRGGFSTQIFSLGDVNGANDVEVADLDGDGDLDIAIGADESIIILENQGFGRFAAAAIQTVSDDVDAIALIDYDLDGRPEIVGVSISEDILIFQDFEITPGVVSIDVPAGAALDSALRFGVDPQVVVRDRSGDPLAFFGNQFNGFRVADVRSESVSGPISANAKTYFDPKDGRTYAVAPSAEGLILYRDNGNFFTQRNIADETRVSETFTNIEPVVGADGLVRIFAFGASGDLYIFEQNGAADDGGEFFFFARNLSTNDLTSSDLGTPSFASPVVSFVTPWNSIHIAGLDSDGRIFTVWTSGDLAGQYTTNDLSEISGAPALVGNLAVFVQPWGAINLSGIDANGDLTVTWWLPSFGGAWRNDSLTDLLGAEAPALIGSTLTAFTTPWAGQNIVGLDGAGDLITVWWSPEANVWTTTNLAEITNNAEPLAIGSITGQASTDASIYIFGTTLMGDVASYTFNAGAEAWNLLNLSETATSR